MITTKLCVDSQSSNDYILIHYEFTQSITILMRFLKCLKEAIYKHTHTQIKKVHIPVYAFKAQMSSLFAKKLDENGLVEG